MDLDQRLGSLTLEQKVSLLAGEDLWHINAVPEAGIGQIRMSDGPNGVRGIKYAGPRSACVPCGAALGATWDPSVVAAVADVIGKEAAARGIQVHLAPTVNLHRTPIGGRNFECFSEDPVLTARLAVAYVQAVQAHRVASCIKHFLANDTEFERHTISSDVDERVLREAYLLPFEDAVHEADVRTVMSSYNRLNGTYAGEHPWLLTQVLRDEWGWDGAVISDWLGTMSTSPALAAGLDVEMPGPPTHRGEKLLGEPVELIDRAVRRVLRLAEWTGRLDAPPLPPDVSEEDPGARRVLRDAVARSIVLLKNDGGLLPLPDDVRRVAVIGPNAARPSPVGGGSAYVRAYRVVSPVDALGETYEVVHEPGVSIQRGVPAMDSTILGDAGATIEYLDPDTEETVATSSADRLRLFWLGTPEPEIKTSQYKVRVSGTVTPDSSGTWTFALSSTGPSRLLLDDEVVVDNLRPERGTTFYGAGSTEVRGTIELEAGVAKRLIVEQFKNTDIGIAGLLVGAQSPTPDDGIARAVAAARDADVAVVVVGTTDEWESEGFDRDRMDLPGEQDELVRAVAAANPRTVVVINTGSPVPMPWLDDIPAVVQAWFGGQELGDGIADVLTGRAEPAGRLPTTFPRRLEDTPAFEHHPGKDGHTAYAEGLFFGYRHYDANDVEPLFPFGHGLGWSTVDYGDASLDGDVVSVPVTNTGTRPTNECVQAYVSLPNATYERPVRQLAGFTRVLLQPGETATARVELHRRSRQTWGDGAWMDEPGPVEVHVGRSSRDLRAVARA
jgi:beta-glucosidase